MAMVHLPLPIDRQLKDAEAVVQGLVLEKNYKRISNENEDIVTEVSLRVIRSAGLKPSDLVNKNAFKIILPGGEWQGATFNYPGSPSFISGEEVVLIIKREKYGFSLSELALSKYLIKTKLGKVYLQSEIFPEHSKLGHIPFEEFDELVNFHLGSSLIHLGEDRSVSKVAEDSAIHSSKNLLREPAGQMNRDEEEIKESRVSLFWLVVIFSVLGLFSIISQRTKS
jgi:hypothetical protein